MEKLWDKFIGIFGSLFEKVGKSPVLVFFSNHRWLSFAVSAMFFFLAYKLFNLLPIVEEGQINIFYSILLVLVLSIAGAFAVMGLNSESVGGGGFQIERRTSNGKIIANTKTKEGALISYEPNTMNILVKKDYADRVTPWKIFFSYCSKPLGQKHKIENLGKFFYVQMIDITHKKMREVILPDTVYLDPRKYVIPLTMPADEAYWKPTLTTWQKLGPAVLIGTILIEWIIFITTG